MGRSLEHREWVGRGIECPTCHTVYFVEQGQNRDRMYHRLTALSGVGPTHSLQTRDQRWTLLCICGQQRSFKKDDVKWYATARAAFERGHAVAGEWSACSRLEAHLRLGTVMYLRNSSTLGKFTIEQAELISEITKVKNDGNLGKADALGYVRKKERATSAVAP